MDSILTALYNGDIYPLEEVERTEPCIAYEKEIEAHANLLLTMLSEEDSQILESLCECMRCLRYDTNELYFKHGFNLATKIMIEVFHDEKSDPLILNPLQKLNKIHCI